MADLRGLRRLIAARSFCRAVELLGGVEDGDLVEQWGSLKPMEKLVVFNLVGSERAMSIFSALPFNEKYFLLLGQGRGPLAPVLEGLPEEARRLFGRMPEGCYDRMLQHLVGAEVEIPLTFERN
jgi:hypothetical protein